MVSKVEIGLEKTSDYSVHRAVVRVPAHAVGGRQGAALDEHPPAFLGRERRCLWRGRGRAAVLVEARAVEQARLRTIQLRGDHADDIERGAAEGERPDKQTTTPTSKLMPCGRNLSDPNPITGERCCARCRGAGSAGAWLLDRFGQGHVMCENNTAAVAWLVGGIFAVALMFAASLRLFRAYHGQSNLDARHRDKRNADEQHKAEEDTRKARTPAFACVGSCHMPQHHSVPVRLVQHDRLYALHV